MPECKDCHDIDCDECDDIIMPDINPEWLKLQKQTPEDFSIGDLVEFLYVNLSVDVGLPNIGRVIGFELGGVVVLFEGYTQGVICYPKNLKKLDDVIAKLDIAFKEWQESDKKRD